MKNSQYMAAAALSISLVSTSYAASEIGSIVMQMQKAIAPVEATTKQPQVITPEKSVLQAPSQPFNLKGFHLKMSKEDVKKIIPNATLQTLDAIGGKDWYGFQCGVIVQQPPSSCNFTFAGEEITAINVAFWDNRAYEIQFYFGPYRPREHKASTVDLNFKMRMAFDTKYPKESNGKIDGTPGGSGTKWESGSESLKVEYVEDKNFLSNSISLLNPSYRAQQLSAEAKYLESKQKNDQIKSNKKLLSDM